MDIIIDALNSVIESVGNGIDSAVSLLSWTPFNAVKNGMSSFPDWVGMLNWFVPFAEMVAVLEAWGLCIAVWYVVSVILRWYRVVE